MNLFSPRYEGIRCLLGSYFIREYLVKYLFPVVTLSPLSYPEVIPNKRNDPHDVGDQYEHTGESKSIWIGYMHLIIVFER